MCMGVWVLIWKNATLSKYKLQLPTYHEHIFINYNFVSYVRQ